MDDAKPFLQNDEFSLLFFFCKELIVSKTAKLSITRFLKRKPEKG